ncbi:hypothetical protein F7984_01730 [Pradoshia sp. D12]|uniref:hypothetical protein n=1 Tax=Bacillaceae TaxID=186817 RepID=UPI00080AC697|nr:MULTISPECIES: hypothetical protein [Bacillaceae]OCA80718.1 hypothetical protein A8L44_16245 [Bacillus sp. FJAT-27986]QFK70072.1 hypothetical protein F7984_01730 [Pradoshia sp. D12]TPF70632.1 hypothetical protein FHY44_16865 [Bacillus sp. D12]
MIKSEAEEIAKKHKKLLEKCTVINYCFNYQSKNWWLAEYKKFPGKKRSGYVIISSVESSYDEKVFVLDHYLSFIGGVLKIQDIVRPRINATDAIHNTLEQMNNVLEIWAENEEEKKLLTSFKGFSEYILWCQEMKNNFYETFTDLGKRVDKERSFTVEDRVQLLDLLPKMDLIMYLQVKRQYEQLEANRHLLKTVKQTKSRFKSKDYLYIKEKLYKYCGPDAEKDFQSIFDEGELNWSQYPATKETFYNLLDSSIQRYKNHEMKELEERKVLIRS